MIYSLRAQPKADESHIQEVPKYNGLIFRMARFQNCGVNQW